MAVIRAVVEVARFIVEAVILFIIAWVAYALFAFVLWSFA